MADSKSAESSSTWGRVARASGKALREDRRSQQRGAKLPGPSSGGATPSLATGAFCWAHLDVRYGRMAPTRSWFAVDTDPEQMAPPRHTAPFLAGCGPLDTTSRRACRPDPGPWLDSSTSDSEVISARQSPLQKNHHRSSNAPASSSPLPRQLRGKLCGWRWWGFCCSAPGDMAHVHAEVPRHESLVSTQGNRGQARTDGHRSQTARGTLFPGRSRDAHTAVTELTS